MEAQEDPQNRIQNEASWNYFFRLHRKGNVIKKYTKRPPTWRRFWGGSWASKKMFRGAHEPRRPPQNGGQLRLQKLICWKPRWPPFWRGSWRPRRADRWIVRPPKSRFFKNKPKTTGLAQAQGQWASANTIIRTRASGQDHPLKPSRKARWRI